MNTLTIETTTGAATLSVSALEIINDIVPLEVAFTTSGSASTASVVQVGYSDVSVGIRAGSQSGRLLASSGLWEVTDGKVRFALVLGAAAQELIAASDSVSVYVEVTLRRTGIPDAKYFATGSAADTAASTAISAHDRDPAAHGFRSEYAQIVRGSLERFFDTSVRPMSQKRIVVFGNSTVCAANSFFTRLAESPVINGMTTTPTAMRAGDESVYIDHVGNIFNLGQNGATLAAMLPDQDNTIPNLALYNPDLVIIRGPLINDVREGATSLAAARLLIRRMLDAIKLCAPWADILLTTENSLLTTDVDGFGWVVPNSAAQAYSEILRSAVLSFAGNYPGVAVYDVQSPLYGVTAPAESPYMLNQLHPNAAGQIAEADLVAAVIASLRNNPAESVQYANAGRNLLPDGRDWTKWGASGTSTVDGEMITIPANGIGGITYEITVTPATQYVFSFYARKGTDLSPITAVYDLTNGGFPVYENYSALINATSYVRIVKPFTTPPGCLSVRLYLSAGGVEPGGTVFCDRAMLHTGSTAIQWAPGTSS